MLLIFRVLQKGLKMANLGPIDTTSSYDKLYDGLIRDPETSYSLRMRVMEDHKLDPIVAMNDAVTLLNLATTRIQELQIAGKLRPRE